MDGPFFPGGRRLVKVPVSASLVAMLCSGMEPGAWVRWDGGVPADARLVYAAYDYARNEFHLYFEHESFRLTLDGCDVMQAQPPSFASLDGAAVCQSADAGGMPPGELRRVLRVPAGADESHTVEG